MAIKDLLQKREYVKKYDHLIDDVTREKYEKDFIIKFTHHSTAIEGNSLTLRETKLVLEDKIAPNGKSLREIYEVRNHEKCWDYIMSCIDEGKSLNENIVKDIHQILVENIFQGGIYRNTPVSILGAEHKPPQAQEAYYLVKEFYNNLEDYKGNSLELAAFTHAEFVKIHPFPDGNGRTSRMMMNYQLVKNGFMPIYINNENKNEYFDALDEYAVKSDMEPFIKIIENNEELALNKRIEYIKCFKNDKKA